MRCVHRLPATLSLIAAAVAVTACGGGGGGGAGGSGAGATGAPVSGKTGGTLKVLAKGDVDHIDPGGAYYQFTYIVTYATQRPLFSYQPQDDTKTTPDLAAGPAQTSADGKTVTIRIRRGIRFSPPVDREVSSKDVKYAIERLFFSTVANSYAPLYFADLVGAKVGAEPGTTIAGIETPDDQTVVFHLRRSTATLVVGALSLPGSAPVPPEYAAKYDAKTPSAYGNHQVATGPYMIQNDKTGKTTGYQPNRRIILVRNPNWNGMATGDYRHAYLDRVLVQEGVDSGVASRQILQGQSQVGGDFYPPPAELKQALRSRKSQLFLAPVRSNHYTSLNTKIAPLDNVNIRRAVVAASDRVAFQLAQGSAALGPVATHFLPLGMAGFEQAGGLKGPGFDFVSNPRGSMAVAAKYLKAAGYPSGKFTGGGKPLLIVGASSEVAAKQAQIIQSQLERLGFKTKLRIVSPDTAYTKFCNVPRAEVAVCPGVGLDRRLQRPAVHAGSHL